MTKESTTPTPSIDALLELLFLVGKLKTTPRTGWTRYPIPHPESVADHSFRVGVMAMLLAPQFDVNQLRVIQMALVHDIGESIIGDVVTDGGSVDLPNLAEKQEAERQAVKMIFDHFGAPQYLELLDELVANTTPEAKFVNQLDKLEMGMQAREYELADRVDLSEFYESVERVVQEPYFTKLLSQLKRFQPH